MARAYKTIRALLSGLVVEVDGFKLRMDDGDIQKGDIYVAERNTEPKLLVCDHVDKKIRCVFPDSNDYAFDLHECVKVKESE